MSEAPVQTGEGRGYAYRDAALNCSHAYLLPTVEAILAGMPWKEGPRRIFDVGCGNGAVAARLTKLGYEMTGVDPSEEGIREAHRAYPALKVYEGSAYDDLAGRFGQFPVVMSLEVVEHVSLPRKFAASVHALLERGGSAIISTPYHGYLKNLMLATLGKMDKHYTALWDQGHIKFWSIRTLGQLLSEAGFASIEFRRVGRIPALAKSMIAVARK